MRRIACAAVGSCGFASSVLAAEGHAGGGGSLITPQFGLIFWTSLTFIILLLLLRRFAWKPILGALETRERQIREDIEQARRGREESEKILEENRTVLVQARRERAEAVEVGRKDAERLKAEILEEARRQRESLLAQTQQQIQAELRSARAELRKEAADLAIEAASRILARNLDDASQRKIVEDYLADLEKLPPGSASLPS
ncbi:MAG TPA: F0F1 ATP synthase subunit B [Candidatus Polarisedimenticolaceae bacterium]